MPRSAIAAGAVDLVLPLAKVPDALARYGGHRYLKAAKGGAALPLSGGLTKIIDLLRKKTPHDFTLYKEGTLGRRIERRMAMAGIEDSNSYLKLLTKDPAAPNPPPEPMPENVPPAPGPTVYWQPGHWGWTGTQWTWLAGHYEQRPYQTAVWEPGHWQQGGSGYFWVDGRWR